MTNAINEMAKKFLVVFVIVITIIGLGKVSYNCLHHHTEQARVTMVQGSMVTVETRDGNVWAFWGDEYQKGQTVKVVFDDNGTESKTDDTIVKAK